ncbi:hypothetical protein [Gemmatimonas sp.]|uniref:hypothetical protein n=1 Tax=Gemmatimonas sp. TaxID=1962908 RepID=UPI00286DA3ED|nr:hypothetical protein [Gemmatimonas sp.]
MLTSPARRCAALLILATSAALRLDAQDTTSVERAAVSGKPSPMLFVTPLLSAGWSQTLGTPKAWKRTWGGYGSRVGDQLGYLAVKTTVRHLVDRAVPWVDDHSVCITPPVSLARETLTRAGCAIVRTSTLRTAHGDVRPNLPFLAGAVIGTVTSLSWRPERQTAVSSRSFVLQRIAITYGATAFVRLVTDWRADARRRPEARQPAARAPAAP